MSQVQQIDRKDLKNQALLERVSQLTAQYENQVAELRVELTCVSQELQELRAAQAENDSPVKEDDVEDKPKKK